MPQQKTATEAPRRRRDASAHSRARCSLAAPNPNTLGRAVQAYRPEGLEVREVVVMLEEGSPALGASEATPVYVDVYDSGYGHGI